MCNELTRRVARRQPMFMRTAYAGCPLWAVIPNHQWRQDFTRKVLKYLCRQKLLSPQTA